MMARMFDQPINRNRRKRSYRGGPDHTFHPLSGLEIEVVGLEFVRRRQATGRGAGNKRAIACGSDWQGDGVFTSVGQRRVALQRRVTGAAL